MRTPETVLIIPAAGAGTRLQSATPKVLAPVSGRAMIDYLFDRYREAVQRFVLVVHPSFEGAVRRHIEQIAPSLDVRFANQQQPTGMLDAILLASEAAAERSADRVWITWCDQIGVHPDTVATLGRLSRAESSTAAILPTVEAVIALHPSRPGRERADNRPSVSAARETRCPRLARATWGCSRFRRRPTSTWLPEFGLEATQASATRERNFLPFIPWLIRHGHPVVTFPSANELEAIGINTPDDRRAARSLSADAGAAVKRLSIVIPAYNEERFIGTLLERIRAVDLTPLGLEKEIIVVDDCSKDATTTIVGRFSGCDA